MKIILRFIIFVATLVGVVAVIIGGIGLGTGNFDFLQRLQLPNLGTVQTAPGSAPATEPTTIAPETETDAETEMVVRFTWRGDEIIYNDSAISEADFAGLLAEAKAKEVKVEIIKLSDVRVEAADRWREMLDEAGVRYEVIPEE
jgi:hypothetical protein